MLERPRPLPLTLSTKRLIPLASNTRIKIIKSFALSKNTNNRFQCLVDGRRQPYSKHDHETCVKSNEVVRFVGLRG